MQVDDADQPLAKIGDQRPGDQKLVQSLATGAPCGMDGARLAPADSEKAFPTTAAPS